MNEYKEWLNKAKSDLILAKTPIKKGLYYEDLCYHTQQSVEKAIKGLIIYFGEEPEYTHNIKKILETLLKYTPIPNEIIKASSLTPFAHLARYPGEYGEISKDTYLKALNLAKKCLKWVESVIQEHESFKSGK